MGCAQKSEFQIFDPLGLGRKNKLKKNYFFLHIFFISSSPLEVHLQSLKKFQRFEEKIQISQEEDLRAS